MASIAFAAIGTGNLQFPPDQVAEIYFDEVISYNRTHPNSSLKDVRFVLHDTNVFMAFKTVEQIKQPWGPSSAENVAGAVVSSSPNEVKGASSDSSLTFLPLTEVSPDHLEATAGTLSFQVEPGSITDETTDAIAVLSNNQLDISSSEAGAAILSKGGPSLKSECSKNAPHSPGSVFIKTGGNLSARYLCHIVPNQIPLTPESLQVTILKCLQEAERRGISSIAFPAIGTGNLSMPAKSCVRAVLSAIREFSNQKPASLKLIRMVIYKKYMIKDVRSAMVEICGKKSAEEHGAVLKLIGKGIKKVAGALGLGGKEEKPTAPTPIPEVDNRKVDLLIFAGSERNLQIAQGEVSRMMAENCKEQKISNEKIKILAEDDMKKIHVLELRHSVQVDVKKEEGLIVVNGLSDDIRQVVTEIYEMLQGLENHYLAEMVSKGIQWKYETKGNFEEYESHLNAQIELAYHQKNSSVTVIRCEEKYKIVFKDMTEEDKDGNVSEVRRIDLRKGMV